MSIRVKIEELLRINTGLSEVGSYKEMANAKIVYRLARLTREVDSAIKDYLSTRDEIIKRYGTLNENGDIAVKAGSKEFEKFEEEVKDLLNEDVELFWVPVKYEEFNPDNIMKLSVSCVANLFSLWEVIE